MATVQKRKAKWRVQFRRDGHRLSRTFHRKADADEWAREAEHSIDRRMNLAIVRLGRGDICGSLINLHLESLRAERTHFGHPKITSCASSHERSDAALGRPDAGTAQSTRPHRGEPKSPSGMARDHPPPFAARFCNRRRHAWRRDPYLINRLGAAPRCVMPPSRHGQTQSEQEVALSKQS